jgi:hypothetical protein
MKKRNGILCLLALASMLAFKPASAQASCAKIQPTRPGEVYLMRGLANIFSLGLDEYGKRLASMGVSNCVYNHSHWKSLANDIIERSYKGDISPPIIIIGHSLGANVAPQMASTIGRSNIPVAFVAMLDPVEPTRVGGNVEEIRNYYLPKRNKDNLLYPGSGFAGSLENINLSRYGGFDHFNIDEKPELRDLIMNRMLALTETPPPQTE